MAHSLKSSIRYRWLAHTTVLGVLALTGCDKGDQQAAAEAQRDAAEKAERAQLEANEKISEARREAEKAANDAARARGEARVELQKDMDAVDRKISYLKEHSAGVQGAAKKNADVARAEAEARRTSVQSSFRKLETESGAAWDSAKAEAQRNISDLKAAVESWENTIGSKSAAKTPAR